MVRPLFSYALLATFGLVVVAIFFPPPCRSRESARRSHCQSNLKQIGLAVLQYTRDYDDHLPPLQWTAAISPYTKTNDIFQCPSTTNTPNTSDYFFNARLLRKDTNDIEQPEHLILAGEGPDDAPLYSTLSQFPPLWRKDENSPAWRHLEMGNYLFADGHVKGVRQSTVPTNFLLP